MNFEGFQPWKILRFGGLVDWDDPTQLPNGVAIVAQNVQYQAESVRTRDGLRHAMSFATDSELYGAGLYGQGGYGDNHITGIDVLRVLNSSVQWASVIFTSDGTLLTESPPGSGILIPIAAANILGSLPFPANASMLTAKAFNRIYMAFSNLKNAMGTPAVIDGPSGNVSPISQNPIGMPWTPGTYAQVGDLVKPPSANGRFFRCTQAGLMQPAEPQWPTLDGYFTLSSANNVFNPPTVTDGVTAWEEWTPAAPSRLPVPQAPVAITNNPGGGTIATGKDVYVRLAYSFAGGATQWSPAIIFANTGVNDALTATFETSTDIPYVGQGGPRIPRWLSRVALHPEIFGSAVQLQIWVGSAVHNAAAPTQYGLYATVDINAPLVITSIPATSQAAPASTVVAPLTTAIFKGETGTRQMIIVRYDQNGQPSPVDLGSPIAVPFTNGKAQPYVFFPPGGSNDSQDVAAFTVVGQSPAGPYFFFKENDPIDPFSSGLQSISRVTNTVTAVLKDASGLVAGETILVTDSGITASPIAIVASPNGVVTTDPKTVFLPAQPPYNEERSYTYYTTATYTTKTPHGLSAAQKISITGVANGIFNVKGSVLAVIDATHFKVAIYSSTLVRSGGGSVTATVGGNLDASFLGEFPLATVDLDSNTVTWPQTAGNLSPAGPFPKAAISVQQTLATQVPAGTVATPLNFDDTSLADATRNNVTEQLNCITLPPCIDVAYLPSTQRMVYASDQEPTGLIFSDPNFPGVIDGENAILDIEISNGGVCIGARETRNGQIVAFKSNGGYAITPNDDVAARWGVNRLWGERGPASARGIGSSRSGSSAESFLVFADPETGLHKYPGSSGNVLDWLSEELKSRRPGELSTWDRVNREAAEQIWVVVDEDQKEIKIGVPLDGASSPSHILTMSYVNGWDPPLMLTLNGEWMESRTSRRWSLDPIATMCAAAVERTLATPIDPRVNTRQILFGMSGNEGGNFVDFQQPNVYDDNGLGIDSRYRPSFAKDAAGRRQLFVGLTGRAIGKGRMFAQPFAGDPDFDPFVPNKVIELGTGSKVVDFAKSVKIPKPRMTIEFSNGGVAGNWFALHEVVFYSRPIGVAAQ